MASRLWIGSGSWLLCVPCGYVITFKMVSGVDSGALWLFSAWAWSNLCSSCKDTEGPVREHLACNTTRGTRSVWKCPRHGYSQNLKKLRSFKKPFSIETPDRAFMFYICTPAETKSRSVCSKGQTGVSVLRSASPQLPLHNANVLWLLV